MQKIKGGYYIKARKSEQSAIAHMSPCTREIWDYLLAKANHKEKKYSGFLVKRGQLFRSYSEIQEALHWMVGWRKMTYHEGHMKKSMKALRDASMISTEKKLGGVLITVLKYDFYQDPENYEGTKKITKEGTDKEPLKNQTPPDNNKKGKKGKNEENDKNFKNIYGEKFKKLNHIQVGILFSRINNYTKTQQKEPSQKLIDEWCDWELNPKTRPCTFCDGRMNNHKEHCQIYIMAKKKTLNNF